MPEGEKMTRQNKRRLALIISMLVFPITLLYFSPALPVEGAFMGVIGGSIFVFIAMFIGSIFLGRLFCAYLCPAGGIQECAFLAQTRTPKRGRRYYIKYFVWTGMIVGTAFGHIVNTRPVEIDFFFATENGISVHNNFYFMIYYCIVLLILLPALISGKRAFCHYICWMAPFMIFGRKIRTALRLPGVYISHSNESCNSCKRCEMVCPMSLKLEEIATDGAIADPECIQCGSCVDSCTKKSLSYKVGKTGK
jgi:polyferredoxin